MTVTICLLIAAALIACDQLIKFWAMTSLAPIGSISVIEGVLRLTYVENRGAAFGIFQGHRWPLVLMTAIILAGVCWVLVSGKLQHPIERLCASLILAGGAGNLLDRVLRGFVVDYIDINELFSYPMFNLADCCVVVGAILVCYSVIVLDARRAKQQAASEQSEQLSDETSTQLLEETKQHEQD